MGSSAFGATVLLAPTDGNLDGLGFLVFPGLEDSGIIAQILIFPFDTGVNFARLDEERQSFRSTDVVEEGDLFRSTSTDFANTIVGDDNYIFADLNGDDQLDSIIQFELGTSSVPRAVAVASTLDPTPASVFPFLDAVGGEFLSLQDGVAAIDAAQVPEPSSFALLGLGALGFLARRKRWVA